MAAATSSASKSPPRPTATTCTPDRAGAAPPSYRSAWADGPPYADHMALQRAKAIYAALGDPEPEWPPYDPDKVGKIPHEDAIRRAIEELRQRSD